MPGNSSPSDRFAARTRKLAAVLRVLLVEGRDEADSLEMLLRLEGHGVQMATDGATALFFAQMEPPDVVLLNFDFPGMHAFEVARRLCAQHRGKRPLLVAVSPLTCADEHRCGREAGIDYHFVRPVEDGELLAVLSRFKEFILPA